MAAVHTNRRELAHRASNGIDVSLFWDEVGDALTLEVDDAKGDEYFELRVPHDRALDAFHHPYAYRAAAGAVACAEPLAA
jgi:hypothetical protein